MADTPENERDEVYQRMLALYDSIPPGPDRTKRFLDKIHGPGWKERAMAAGPLTLEYGRRLRELEVRVSRIERHLSSSGSEPPPGPKTKPIDPLPPWSRDE
jgi:hypothetical protein